VLRLGEALHTGVRRELLGHEKVPCAPGLYWHHLAIAAQSLNVLNGVRIQGTEFKVPSSDLRVRCAGLGLLR